MAPSLRSGDPTDAPKCKTYGIVGRSVLMRGVILDLGPAWPFSETRVQNNNHFFGQNILLKKFENIKKMCMHTTTIRGLQFLRRLRKYKKISKSKNIKHRGNGC